MSDLIDRKALRREIYKDMAIEDNKRVAQLLQAIMDAPSVDAEPVIHGWWIPFSDHMWACSNCRVMGSPQWKRCPVCETKMDGGAEDD